MLLALSMIILLKLLCVEATVSALSPISLLYRYALQ
jgi:hypothetical protein